MQQLDTPGTPSSAASDLGARSLGLLEFPAVLERLAIHATFVLGREAALALRPSFDPDVVARRQQETREARRLLARADPDLSAARDIRGTLRRAAMGGVLTGPELLEVHDTLYAVRRFRDQLLRGRQEAPALGDMAGRIADLKELEDRIAKSIERHGEVADNASPALRELRAEVRVAYARLEAALGRIVRSSLGVHVLQDAVITQREGRLVLPLKIEHRGRLPGLVHDVSESGATLFVEPLAAVPLGNRWRQLKAAEEREAVKVLRELSALVERHAEDLLAGLELAARLDLALAKARYAVALDAFEPVVPTAEQAVLRLTDARHPLLTGPVVPNTIEVGDGWRVLLITGPNAGGKTVALKTAGLLALMHQAGLQVPAAPGSLLSVFDAVFADIGDQQSIDRSLSTFAAHIAALRVMLGRATPRSLVLVDELGASTDPEEGAALAKALLGHLVERGVTTIATTHHRDVAAYAQETPGMMNASVELDPATLAPTYRLTAGLPGRSYALAIAAQLGLPREVVESARAHLAPLQQQMEVLLADLGRERAQAAAQRQEAEAALRRAEELRQELEGRLAEVEKEKAAALEEVHADLQRKAEEVLGQLREASRALEGGAAMPVAEALRTAQRLRRELGTPEWQAAEEREWVARLRPGDWVRVRGFPQPGIVQGPPDPRGTVEVIIGALKARVALDQLERALPTPTPPWASGQGLAKAVAAWQGAVKPVVPRPSVEGPHPAEPATEAIATPVPQVELDLRGERAEEALRRLEKFLDQALLQGYTVARVVHGAGTGALRVALRERLAKHPLVRAWQPDTSRRGDGATIVLLA
ncbi:MAG: endonuclease MutS2 [Chloroflexi bacterium]|nr:endonuclease MutS2 [Chloroflexota bacterium]